MMDLLTDQISHERCLSKIVTDPIERLHVSFLKWTLGVSKRTSNAAVWGDCGRMPLVIQLTKQLVDYYNRLVLLEQTDSQKLVRHAFVEQRSLGLPWFAAVNKLTAKHDPQLDTGTRSKSRCNNSVLIKKRCEELFAVVWDQERLNNKNLIF